MTLLRSFLSSKTFTCIIRGIILAFIVLSVMHEILRLRKHFLRADNYNAITTMIWFNNKNEDHYSEHLPILSDKV